MENPGFMTPIVVDILAKEGISKEQVHGFEVITQNLWVVDVKGQGSYLVDTDKKEIVR